MLTSRSGSRLRRCAAAPAVAGAVLLAACSGGEVAQDPPSTTPTASSGSTSASPSTTAKPKPATAVMPLTGASGPADVATRTTVAVAVSTGTGRPGAKGLDKADVVYVHFPTAGRQRAVALFQSSDSGEVGPVTQTRPVDGKLVLVPRAVLMHSGGAPGFVKQLVNAKIPQWSTLVQPSSYRYDSAAAAWYGSSASGRKASGAADARAGLFSFQATPESAGKAKPVRVDVPGQPAVTLAYDAKTRTWSGTLGGLRIRATNVVLQRTKHEDVTLPRTGGQTEDSPEVYGNGSSTVLSGSRVLSGTWNRPGRSKIANYVDAKSTPIRMYPGRTWVLLVPAGTTVDS